jgi:hypothetical protein
MTGPLLLSLLLIIVIVVLVTRVPSEPPTPRAARSFLGAIRSRLFGDGGDYRPRPRAYLTGNLPKSWPIRNVLVQANDEMLAMQQTLVSARAVGVPAEIIRSYEANMKQAGLLLNRNSDRVIHASRTGPVSLPLAEALTRKQRSLQHLLDALQMARGSLAAVIVTGLDDQRDLDRVARSLQAWSEALGAVSSETAADLPPLAAPGA